MQSTTALPQVVVVGAGYAGLAAALTLAASAPGRADIRLVDASPCFPQRIRTHQRMAGQAVATPPLESLLENTGIRLQRGRVVTIDRAARVVHIADGAVLPYDRLVWAAGSAVVGTVPGASEHAIGVNPGGSIEAVREKLVALSRRGSGRVVVAGAGLTGVEIASEIAEAFPMLRVELVGHVIGDGLGEGTRTHVVGSLRSLGVVLHEGVGVRRVDAAALVTDRGDLPFDLCLWTIGFTAPPLAGEAGLAVNARGQVLVDATLRSTTDGNIYAAGDTAFPVVPVGAPILMSCRIGGPMGLHVGRSLARELRGLAPEPFHYRDTLRCVSLGRRNGVVELHHGDGRVRGVLATGRLAAWIKEKVCQSTLWSIYAFAWAARRRHRSALPPSRRLALSP